MNITQSEREGASLAPSVSVIIPAYNEAAAIGRVIERLKRYVDGFGFEVNYENLDYPDVIEESSVPSSW